MLAPWFQRDYWPVSLFPTLVGDSSQSQPILAADVQIALLPKTTGSRGVQCRRSARPHTVCTYASHIAVRRVPKGDKDPFDRDPAPKERIAHRSAVPPSGLLPR